MGAKVDGKDGGGGGGGGGGRTWSYSLYDQVRCEYNSFHYRALEGRETSR